MAKDPFRGPWWRWQGGSGDGGNNTPARPEWAPEKFWNAAKGESKAQDLATSYGNLEKLVGKKATEPTSDEFKVLVDHRVAGMRGDPEKEISTKLLAPGQRSRTATSWTEFQKSILDRNHPQHVDNMKKLTDLHGKAAIAT